MINRKLKIFLISCILLLFFPAVQSQNRYEDMCKPALVKLDMINNDILYLTEADCQVIGLSKSEAKNINKGIIPSSLYKTVDTGVME